MKKIAYLSFKRETTNENNQVLKIKTWISNSFLTDKAFNDTIVKSEFSSKNGESVEITFTPALLAYRIVKLISKDHKFLILSPLLSCETPPADWIEWNIDTTLVFQKLNKIFTLITFKLI